MRGEKYVYTAAEAEKAGFRRARKWRPDQKNSTFMALAVLSGCEE
jgi:hypothetical protein